MNIEEQSSLRKSIARIVGALLLTVSLGGSVLVTPASAAPSQSCTDPRDTTGSCMVVTTVGIVPFSTCTIGNPSCKPYVFQTAVSHAYPYGLILVISPPARGTHSISTGDVVRVRVSANGMFTFTVTQPNGMVRSSFQPPVLARTPTGYDHLEVLTASGFKPVKGNLLQGSGLFRWVHASQH